MANNSINIGRSDEWKKSEVYYVLGKLLESDKELYEKVLDTKGYAYWHNILVLIAVHRTWSVSDAQEYLKTGSKDRKDWYKT